MPPRRHEFFRPPQVNHLTGVHNENPADLDAAGNNLGRTAITQAVLDHTLRQAAAYDALAALVSDVEAISKNP